MHNLQGLLGELQNPPSGRALQAGGGLLPAFGVRLGQLPFQGLRLTQLEQLCTDDVESSTVVVGN